jgi:hypothetical protein
MASLGNVDVAFGMSLSELISFPDQREAFG